MLAAGGKLVAVEPEPAKVGPHGELLVLDLRLLRAGAPLGQRLVVERKGEDDVAPNLAGVQRAVEASQFHRVVAVEEAVEVEEVMRS